MRGKLEILFWIIGNWGYMVVFFLENLKINLRLFVLCCVKGIKEFIKGKDFINR